MKKLRSLLTSLVMMTAALLATCCSSAMQPTAYYPRGANVDLTLYRDMGYWREEIVLKKKEQKTETNWPFVTAFVFLGLFIWQE